MEKEQTQAPGAGLIYGLNDRPPVKETIFAALQHLLAIFVAIITPPLIIAGALKQLVFSFLWLCLHLVFLHLFSAVG